MQNLERGVYKFFQDYFSSLNKVLKTTIWEYELFVELLQQTYASAKNLETGRLDTRKYKLMWQL